MKILCPTDFSEHSAIALEYAMNLAKSLDSELHILSVFQVPKSSTSFVSMEDVIRRNHEEDMQKLISGLGALVDNDNLPVTRVAKGDTVSTTLRYADQKQIDLIVMGTQGGNSLRTILFGSTTKKLAGKSPIPILAIPETVRYRLTSNRIVLALDNKALDNEHTFAVPVRIAKALSLKIDVLHVGDEEDITPFDPFVSAYLEGLMGDVALESGQDTIAVIKHYVESNDVGMLMMIRRDKSFLQRILTVGNTDAELAKTNVPLMILPE